MNYIPYDEVVSEAITAIGAEGEDEIAKQYVKTFLWRGLQKLGDSNEQLETVKLYTKNLLIKKPKDYKKLDSICLYDSADNQLPHLYHSGKRVYPQTDGINYYTTDSTGVAVSEFVGPIDISENEQNFVLGTNGTDVAYMLLRYWQYPLDADGIPLIREDEVEALILYARLRWSMRKNVNQSEIRENRIAWMQAADQCKALKKSTSNEEAKTIHRSLNRMIPNFNRSRH
jgi:hypothetical protein